LQQDFRYLFIASSDYHSFLILTGKASALIPSSKLIGEQKEVFRNPRTKISVCSSATVTFLPLLQASI
jgi:hypothetical protein